MHTSQVYVELDTVNKEPHKWWHHRWVKITGISIIVLIVFAVILALVLNFVVFAPKKSETSTTAATSSSSSSSSPSPPLTTTPLVTPTTTQQTSKLQSNVFRPEVYDPSTGIWTTISDMADARAGHTASVLSNGKVLITGGVGYVFLNSAELFDPSTGIWTTTGSMNNGRHQHTASVLSNGKVLVTGGFHIYMGYLNSAELYQFFKTN
ncbi:unnamed protein product [Adineta steineri]|uniref:Uncharacterized protein n=2 Tax=Adineta steineri TaxID=433720 RepID=A0A815PH43_9BILA|nr:unnamed protein product [Adineta steineri]